MSFDLFPSKVNSVRASTHRKLLKWFRMISLVTILVLAGIYYNVYGALENYVNTWLIILPFLFEALSVIVEFTEVKWLDRLASFTFIICWPLSTVFAIFSISMNISYGYFSLYPLLSFVPWLILVADFVLNKVSFVRMQYIFVGIISAFFIFYLVNDFRHFSEFYPDYAEWTIKIGMLLSVFIILEASRLIKIKCCEKSEAEKSLM